MHVEILVSDILHISDSETVETSYASSSSSGTSIGVALSIGFVVIAIVFVIAYRIIQQQRIQSSLPTTPYTYQATTGQLGIFYTQIFCALILQVK